MPIKMLGLNFYFICIDIITKQYSNKEIQTLYKWDSEGSQMAGSLPFWGDLSKMILMIGVISSRGSLSRRGLSLSGPAALLGFRFLSSFNSPIWEMLISGMVVTESCNVSGMVSEGGPSALFKSPTRILARRESHRGSLGVKQS